jgi:hypothetical protein
MDTTALFGIPMAENPGMIVSRLERKNMRYSKTDSAENYIKYEAESGCHGGYGLKSHCPRCRFTVLGTWEAHLGIQRSAGFSSDF